MKKIGMVLAIVLWASLAMAKEGDYIPFQLQQRDTPRRLSAEELEDQVEKILFEKTNDERYKKSQKLKRLEKNEKLKLAAEDHAADMLARHYFSHFSPEKKSVVDRLKKYIPKLQTFVGENLHTVQAAKGLHDASAIADLMMKDWMQSPSHRVNILAQKFYYLGVGCASDLKTIYCVQVFGGEGI